MKVFISWSGERSKAVAEALHEWLPSVIQAVKPWMSAEDIDKGARWGTDIARELEQTRVGLICLTPENLNASWILFEAGALSKTLDKTFVCPYLLRVKPSDLQGPLVQFQATKAEKEDTRKLLYTINKALGDQSLSEVQVGSAFEKWWPDLETRLKSVPPGEPSLPQRRPDGELLEEILELVRRQARSPIPTSVSEAPRLAWLKLTPQEEAEVTAYVTSRRALKTFTEMHTKSPAQEIPDQALEMTDPSHPSVGVIRLDKRG